MLLKITERNMWERESWSHIIDLNKQDGEALNRLLIFTRLANAQCEETGKAAKSAGHGSLYAASRYEVRFFEKHEINDRSILLKNKSGNTLVVSKASGYKNSELNLDRKISPAKMKSALKAIRDKKQNVLYKNFESVFLKNKS